MEKIYQTLQQFFASIDLPLVQDLDITVHHLKGLHGDKPFKSPLFRTNYYTFILAQSGKARYCIDGQWFDILPQSFYFTNPGHLKCFEMETSLTGFMLTFSESFIRQYFQGDFFQQFPYLIHETTPLMYLETAQFEPLAALAAQMLSEYEATSAFKVPILANQLMVLLYKTKALLLTHRVTLVPQNAAEKLVHDFKQQLNQHFQVLLTGKTDKMITVKTLAESLHVHPNHLTTLVSKTTGKSASEWIYARATAEAKAMLLDKNKRISDIAFMLGFSDTTHFAKFFKKQTAQTPTNFKKTQQL